MATYPFTSALVTGASSGMGRDLAILLASYGARLALADQRLPELEELKEDYWSQGGFAPW